MQHIRDARSAAWRQDERAAETGSIASTHQTYSSIGRGIVALEVFKRGRWSVVGKVTILDGKRILAIAHRAQHGVKTTISLPVVAVNYAERAGCGWLYFRRDQTGQMWRLPLPELRRVGWLATSDGVAEYFIRIERMQPVRWRKWEFAEEATRLGEPEASAVQQLDLFGEVAV